MLMQHRSTNQSSSTQPQQQLQTPTAPAPKKPSISEKRQQERENPIRIKIIELCRELLRKNIRYQEKRKIDGYISVAALPNIEDEQRLYYSMKTSSKKPSLFCIKLDTSYAKITASVALHNSICGIVYGPSLTATTPMVLDTALEELNKLEKIFTEQRLINSAALRPSMSLKSSTTQLEEMRQECLSAIHAVRTEFIANRNISTAAPSN